MKTSDWNPQLYLKFVNERTQPSIDLVSRIRMDGQPRTIVDLGCGPGNSTGVLADRWPGARIIGVDNSPAMIDQARRDHPTGEWVLADAFAFKPNTAIDLIFSNAAIQWLPDHTRLFQQLSTMLAPGGIIAVQVPQFSDMPLGWEIRKLSLRDRWASRMEGCADLFTFHDYRYYYDLLAGTMKTLDMWVTEYVHVMPSHNAIIEWIRSTGLKPYLDCIADSDEAAIFENEILKQLPKHYPLQIDGSVLFPFKRLFFIGYE